MMHLFGIAAAGSLAIVFACLVPLLFGIPAMVAAWACHRHEVRRTRRTLAPAIEFTPATVRVDDLRLTA